MEVKMIGGGIVNWAFVNRGCQTNSLWIQTLSEKVLKPPNYSKLYPKHFLRRYLDP